MKILDELNLNGLEVKQHLLTNHHLILLIDNSLKIYNLNDKSFQDRNLEESMNIIVSYINIVIIYEWKNSFMDIYESKENSFDYICRISKDIGSIVTSLYETGIIYQYGDKMYHFNNIPIISQLLYTNPLYHHSQIFSHIFSDNIGLIYKIETNKVIPIEKNEVIPLYQKQDNQIFYTIDSNPIGLNEIMTYPFNCKLKLTIMKYGYIVQKFNEIENLQFLGSYILQQNKDLISLYNVEAGMIDIIWKSNLNMIDTHINIILSPNRKYLIVYNTNILDKYCLLQLEKTEKCYSKL